MKILVDATTTQDQLANRGIGRYTKELVTGLVKSSAENNNRDTIFLLTFNSPTTLEQTINEHPGIVRTINIGKLRMSNFLNGINYLLQFRPAINKLRKEENIDLYFCPYFWKGFPLKKDFKTVVTIHDLAFAVMDKYSYRPWIFDRIRKIQYHFHLKRTGKAAGVISDSQNTKNDYLRFVKSADESDVKVVHLGLSDEFMQVTPDKDILANYLPHDVIERGYVFYYGGIEPNKNVLSVIKAYDEFLKIWKRNQKDKKPPFLVLGGRDFTVLDMRNKMIADIRFLIQDLGLGDFVYFTGYFNNEHTNDLIAGAELFVHLSIYEGFGFAALEPMKCGAPVVASNRSCYPEVLKDGARMVDPDDIETVAQAYYEIISDEEEAQRLCELGQNVASGYTWESTVDQTYKYFQKLVENNEYRRKKQKK